MNGICLKENVAVNNYIEQRKAQVKKITAAYSKKLFGNEYSSMKETRTEATRIKLEAIFNV